MIVAFWIAAAAASFVYLPTIEETQTSGLGDLVPTDSETVDAEVRAARLFGFPLFSRTLIVEREREGLEPIEQACSAAPTS